MSKEMHSSHSFEKKKVFWQVNLALFFHKKTPQGTFKTELASNIQGLLFIHVQLSIHTPVLHLFSTHFVNTFAIKHKRFI